MCDKAICKELFMLKYCLDTYKTQEMCDEALDSYLVAIKLAPDWFVTSEIMLYSYNDDVVFGDIDSDIVTFFSNDVGLKGALSGLRQFLATESPLKNTFYFTLKALFFLRIFKFLF